MRRDGTILVNQNDPHVIDLAREFPGQKITFGVEKSADVMAKEVRLRGQEGTAFKLILEDEEIDMVLPLLGRHFRSALLLLLPAASFFGSK